MLPLGQCTVLLVDSALLSASDFLALVDAHFKGFNFTLKSLVLGDGGVDLSRQLSDFLVSGGDLSSNGLDLLRNFNSFLGLVTVLCSEHFQFVLAAVDDACLASDLSLEVASQNCNALFVSFLSSGEVFNLSSECSEVPLAELV